MTPASGRLPPVASLCRPLLLSFVLLSFVLLSVAALARPASARPVVAYIDVADRYTGVAGLGPWLESARGIRAVDVTDAARRGRLGLKRSRALIIGSFATADSDIRAGLERARSRVRAMLKRGGTVVVLAQARGDAPSPVWLPRGLVAERGQRDGHMVRLRDGRERLLTRPRRLRAEELAGWFVDPRRPERWSSVASTNDAFRTLRGFRALAWTAGEDAFPVAAVAAVGRGRVVLVQMAPDKVLAAPGAPAQGRAAERVLQNLLSFAREKHARAKKSGKKKRKKRRGKKSAAVERPDPPFEGPHQRRVAGEVFEDRDGDGERDEGEPPIAGVAVSHGFATSESDPDGAFSTTVDIEAPGWIAITVPDGYRATTPWWLDAWQVGQRVRFGLQRIPPEEVVSSTQPLVVAQLTDLHVGAKPLTTGRELLADAVATVRGHQPRVGLVLNTGDVTASGAPPEFETWARAKAQLGIPVLEAMGNHDLTRGPDRGTNFLRALGPWAHDTEFGGRRFVVLYKRAPDHAAVAWARERIARSSLPVVLVVHHYPPRRLLKALGAEKAQVIVSGDWHDAEVRGGDGGPVDVNSAPTLMGGWDHSPAAVRFLTLGVDGSVETSLRYLRLDQHLRIAAPAEAPASREPPLIVQAYDSVSRVETVRWRLAAVDGGTVSEGELRRQGAFAWVGCLPSPLPVGTTDFIVRARAADGREWSVRRQVTVEAGTEVAAAVGQGAPGARVGSEDGWPSFLPPQRARARGPQPPLSLAWAKATGGEVYAGGAVVADGRVYVGLMDRASVGAQRAGVVALELARGDELWRYPTSSSVRHAPTVSEGLVVAQTTAGDVVALDDATGALRWRYRLAGETPPAYPGYYVLAAPLVHRGRVWVGPSAAPRVLELETGEQVAALRALDGQPAVTYASPVPLGRGQVAWPTRHRGVHVFRSDVKGESVRAVWRSRRLRMSATPFARDGQVWAPAHDGLYVLEKGRVRKKYKTPPGTSAATPLVVGGTVYVPGSDGVLRALERRSGRVRWSFKTGPALMDFQLYRARSRGLSSSPVACGDSSICFGGHDGYVYALDRADGAVRWQRDLGVPVTAAPAFASGYLLFVDHGGVVYAYRSESRE